MDSGKQEGSVRERIRSKLADMNRQQWIVLLLLGLLLAVAAMPTSGKKQSNTPDTQTEDHTTQIDKTVLEEKLENILSTVEGVGEVQVMLMADDEKDAQGFYGKGTQKVTGVLICARGADDPVVVHNIQQAVMSLFQVEAHKIKVMKMK